VVGIEDVITSLFLKPTAFLEYTLASNLVGGFKEGVGFARKFCQSCEVTSDTSGNLFLHED